jgi:hypothetical protein
MPASRAGRGQICWSDRGVPFRSACTALRRALGSHSRRRICVNLAAIESDQRCQCAVPRRLAFLHPNFASCWGVHAK